MLKLETVVVQSIAPKKVQAQSWPELAGYAPETDVREHSLIDLDQEAIEACFRFEY